MEHETHAGLEPQPVATLAAAANSTACGRTVAQQQRKMERGAEAHAGLEPQPGMPTSMTRGPSSVGVSPPANKAGRRVVVKNKMGGTSVVQEAEQEAEMQKTGPGSRGRGRDCWGGDATVTCRNALLALINLIMTNLLKTGDRVPVLLWERSGRS